MNCISVAFNKWLLTFILIFLFTGKLCLRFSNTFMNEKNCFGLKTFDHSSKASEGSKSIYPLLPLSRRNKRNGML